jgi:molybdopterin converting factor small subunit
MPVEVRIPTILRSHTGGARSVDARGASLREVLTDLESRHTGVTGRMLEGEKLRRFVNVYVNDEDVRFTGGLDTPVADGDSVTILPAVAGGSGR